MILILSGSDEGREIATMLSDAGNSVIVSVPTVLDAAKHTTQMAVAGEMDFERLSEFIEKYNISGIVDAKRAFSFDLSSDAKRAANAYSIPYIKYVKRPLVEAAEDEDVIRIDHLDDFYDYLERNLHNTLLDVDDSTIELILDGLADTSFLYVACIKGVNRDYVEELVRREIPLTNILEVDGVNSEEESYNTYKKYDIKNVVIKDGAFTAANKIKAAKRCGAAVVALDTDRMASCEFCSTLEQVLDTVESWK
ncbi:MAG: precorrin-6A/cobalt-precorrin-6A reductase [Oscillospiraceae bacterium]|nr:precorrin-6A/cobalt-precorrin-6A reductase [Oscillospiraceae bacterium]